VKKHAFLIIVHHELDVLDRLIKSLDDERNDLYIHFDKKILAVPTIKTNYSKLIVLTDEHRVDVSWGDVSMIQAELNLFKISSQQDSYAYYHLISGVDMPLKKMDLFHNFFLENQGKEFVGFYQGNLEEQFDLKVRKYHLFPTSFRHSSNLLSFTKRLIRYLFIKLQYLVKFKRNKAIDFKKGTQWVSISDDLIKFIIKQEKQLLSTYKYTFCSDEIFIQTIVWNSSFRERIYNQYDEGRGSLRAIQWIDNVIHDWQSKDIPMLMNSEYVFARKFNSRDLDIVDNILNQLKN